MVAQLVALLPCSKKVLCSTSGRGGLSAWRNHALDAYSGFLPQSKNMTVRLIGFCKLPLDVNEWLFVLYVSVLPCDGLATCPGCTPLPAYRVLEIGTSFPATHYGRSGRK
ncbi:hypothetical protein ILYODFUR_013487 [Ilyodon furcidens]|uniref:Uncharacterized protein n=1 Tax=Ilyodon furcidens TaxID=33524 RepID=A0ABV0UFR6_9TELE